MGALGDSADHASELAKLKAALEQHVTPLQQLKKCQEKHAKDMECATGRHDSIEDRLKELERYVGDSAAKHNAELDAHKKLHGCHANDLAKLKEAHACNETLGERVERVEAVVADLEASMG